RPVERAQQHVRDAVVHVVGRAALRGPDPPARAVPRALAAVVAEREPTDPTDLPAARGCADLVEAVPAHALVEREHVVQAGAAVGARRAPDVCAGDAPLAPGSVHELEAAPACEAELGLGLEGPQEALEVLG